MLALSRKTGQAIRFTHLGVETVIHVLKARGSKVRVGIEAPLSVKVDRPEMDKKRSKIHEA